MIENGWKLVLPSKKKTMSVDAHFLCRCGDYKSVTLEHAREAFPEHVCEQCGNMLFLSYNRFINPLECLHLDEFKYSSRTFKDDEGWNVVLAYKRPVYDLSEAQFAFEVRLMLLMTLSYDGEMSVSILDEHATKKPTYDGKSSAKLEVHLRSRALCLLSEYILENRPEELRPITQEILLGFKGSSTLKLIRFLLQNKSVQETELYFWKRESLACLGEVSSSTQALDAVLGERNEKSVRRALFAYYSALAKPKAYDPAFDYIVLRTFTNPNYLAKLLSLPAYHKNNCFTNLDLSSALQGMNFLSTFYDERELFRLFEDAMSDKNRYRLLSDCFRMIYYPRDLDQYREHYVWQKPKVVLVHDELVRVQNFHISPYSINLAEPFEYDERYLQTQLEHKGLYFKLPGTSSTLHEWGKVLHNCIFSYAKDIFAGHSVIVGVYKEKKLTYAVELKDGQIRQARSAFNAAIPRLDRELIDEWHTIYLSTCRSRKVS